MSTCQCQGQQCQGRIKEPMLPVTLPGQPISGRPPLLLCRRAMKHGRWLVPTMFDHVESRKQTMLPVTLPGQPISVRPPPLLCRTMKHGRLVPTMFDHVQSRKHRRQHRHLHPSFFTQTRWIRARPRPPNPPLPHVFPPRMTERKNRCWPLMILLCFNSKCKWYSVCNVKRKRKRIRIRKIQINRDQSKKKNQSKIHQKQIMGKKENQIKQNQKHLNGVPV